MVFSLRIVNADFYTTEPLAGLDPVYSDFRSSKILKVPVIRIFGATPTGQKCCLHIHGVFPYICIPYGGDEPKETYLKQFATSVDFALHVSQGKASSSNRHVHEIEIISGRSFYGYHEEEQEFMKVYFYNPFVVTRVVDLLQNGAVMNKVFQPYESHIPYIQQMFIDYNLYGMNLLNTSAVMFRTPIQLKPDDPTINEGSVHSPITPLLSPSSHDTGSSPGCHQFWTEDNVPRNSHHALEVERLSVCELEVDTKAQHIMNQFEIGTSIGTNPGLVAIWQDERQRRQDEKDDSDLGPPISQERGYIPLLQAEQKHRERLEQIVVERNLAMQSQSQRQDNPSNSISPNDRESSSFDINENTPIVDHSIVEEVVKSSQRTMSQERGNCTDMQMVEILASLAEDQSQSRRMNLTPAGITSGDEEDEDEVQDEDVSVMMSQQVWDDTYPTVNSDDNDESGTKNCSKGAMGSQGSPLRMSQFDLHGLDHTWEVSLLSEELIPQLDGNYDDIEDMPSKVCTRKKKSVLKRSSPTSRRSKLTKVGSLSNPSISSSKVLVVNKCKHKVTHRLGMSSVRLTRQATRNDMVQSQSKQHNEEVDVDTIPKHETTVRKAKPSSRIPPLSPVRPSENCCTKLTQSKNSSPQFSLYVSERTSSAEEDISHREGPIAKLDGCSGRKAAHLISCAPEITHITDNEIPCVTIVKGENTTGKKMSMSLSKRHRGASYLRDNNDESSIALGSDRHLSGKLEQTVRNKEDVCITRKINETTSTEVESRKCFKPFSIPSERLDVTVPEIPAEREQNLELQSPDHKKQYMKQTIEEYGNGEDDQRREKQKLQQVPRKQLIQQLRREKTKSDSKLETSYKDIKKRVFAEYKPFPKKRKNEKATNQLCGKDVTENYQSIGSMKNFQKPIENCRHISDTLIKAEASSEVAKANTRKDDISQGKESIHTDDVLYCRPLEFEVDGNLRLAGKHAKAKKLFLCKNKVNDCGIFSDDKLSARVENRDCEKPIQKSESSDCCKIPTRCLEVCLTNVATVQSKRHLYNAALERWKRRNTELNTIEEAVSRTPVSPIKTIRKDTTKTKTRKSSPKTSPKGKRYGLLDVTIHTSPRLKSCPVNSPSLSPSKSVRSSTVPNRGSQAPCTTSIYVSSTTGSSHQSPQSSSTNLQPRLARSQQFASSPERCKRKSMHSSKAHLHRTIPMKSPRNAPTPKRNIFTQVDKSFLQNSQKLNDIDRLFDTLGSCFSKEEVTSRVSSKECREENPTKVSNRQFERDHCEDCVRTEVFAKQTPSNEVKKTHEKVKRKRSESETPSRKQPKLSLKLKSRISSKTQNRPYNPGSGTAKKNLNCIVQEQGSIGKSSSLADESSKSPSILDVEKPLSRMSTPEKFEANSDFTDMKNVTSSLGPSCDETQDSAGSVGIDSSSIHLTEKSKESLNSSEENCDEDSFANLSPDLFESALLKMSYLSPEHREKDVRASPPLPSTPSKTSDTDYKVDGSQGVIGNKKQLFRRSIRSLDKGSFGLLSPDISSELSDCKLSKYCSEYIDWSLNSSTLNVGLSEGQPSLALEVVSCQNVDQSVIASKSSPPSPTAVNRTCTTESEEYNGNRSQEEIVRTTDTLYDDNGRNETPNHGRANDTILKNHESRRTNSALNVLHQYCKRIQREKDALMGVDVDSSHNSNVSTSTDEPTSVSYLSQDGVCSTRYSVISPSCSTDTTSPKENLSVDSPSLMCDNVDSVVNDTSLSSSNEMSPAIDNEIQCSGNYIDTPFQEPYRSPHSISKEQSIEADVHISSSLCKETSLVHISSIKESRCRSDSNEAGSLVLRHSHEGELNIDRSLISYKDGCSRANERNERDRLSNVGAKSLSKSNDGRGAVRTDDGHYQFCQTNDLKTEETDQNDFHLSKDKDIIVMPQKMAPPAETLIQSLKDLGIPRCRYQEPFYSEPSDVSDTVMDVGGRLLKVQSNQVKILPSFDTSSPFLGIQGMREILCASHETSFLDACQDNIGTADTFLSGIENNPELKIAFMGDKRLAITPCKLPPHSTVVRSWAQKKVAKKYGHTKYDNKGVETSQGGLQSSPACKIRSSGPSDVRSVAIENSLDDDFNIDTMSGGTRLSDQKDERLTCSQKAQNSSSCTEKEKLVVFQDSSQSHKSFPLEKSVCEFKADSGNRLMQPEITIPNTLFSPVDKTFSFSVETQSKIAGGSDYDPSLIRTDGENRTYMNDEEKERMYTVHQGSALALQSTPVPHKLARKGEAVSLSTKTPTSTTSLPRFPFLTPITGPTQVSSFEERSTSLSSLSGVDARKTSNKTVNPKRHLITSQLKLLTPENALRRHVSEAGSEIEGPSPINTAGYKVPQLNIQDAKASHEVQHLTLLSVELHVRTRKDRKPDPEFDPICALFFHVQTDSDCPTKKVTGIICVDKNSAEFQKNADTSKCGMNESSARSFTEVPKKAKRPILERSGVTQYRTQYVEEEKDLFHTFLYLVRKWDPDILIGYELQMLSWGYLIQRALVFDLDLGKLLSRVKGSSSDCNVDAEKDKWGAAHSHELKIGGRIILNVWRLMRHEVALNVYTFENVAFHVLHERIPLFTFRTLSDWWDHKTDSYRWRTVEHYIIRCQGNVRLLEQFDFVGRTSELARLFGILFYSVISRGSQFRVESMMLRISKPLNYLAISPSVQQRNSMNAPEVIALVLEPESRFYSNPVLVLDFQSLYPSMIIAYNYCYSTCLGRVSCLEELGEFKFGASTLSVPPMLIKKLKDDIHISPNGVAFVKSNVRLGVLPKMLEDILNTRIMVKNSMKKWKNKKSVHRMLDARQLGLKLIANVTYGYTAAHFSGRMPCVELGDSIVRKARETLEHAIHVVNTTSKWGARVVYGDTDSMFVLLDGCSKDEAFHIGRDIAQTITALNPKPVKLKFEKVYLPCVLQTKKRYVGYMYETPDQKEPVFDAKGIETVRRDTCPAVAKVLEKSLRLLFEKKDVSLIKRYVQRQFSKMIEGRISLQDLTFAKEYRGMASYKPGACVPALELTRRMLKEDRRSEPRVGERVPYVIVYGSPGLPLIKLVKRPHEVLQDPSLRINALYYITKQLIPPLNRALSLIGVDVRSWFAEVPRTSRVKVQPFDSSDTRKKTISHYFTTTNCPVCQQTTTSRLCDACTNDPQKVVVTLNNQIRQHERRHRHLTEICYQCCGSRDTKLCCVSLDCPVFHKLFKASRDLEPSNHFRQLITTAFA